MNLQKLILFFAYFALSFVASAADVDIAFVETGSVELMAGVDYEVEVDVSLPSDATDVTVESVSLFDNDVLFAEMQYDAGRGHWIAPIPNINSGIHQFKVLVIDSDGEQTTSDSFGEADASTSDDSLRVGVLPLNLSIDFGPEEYSPEGSEIALDTGLVIGSRAVTTPIVGDFYYGWTQELNAYADIADQYTGSPASGNIAWDSYRKFRSNEGYSADWELQVPDGVYLVDIWVGDSAYGAEAYELLIEGTPTGTFKTKDTGSTYEGWHAQVTKLVHVEDGKLTLSDTGSPLPVKINRLSIKQIFAPDEDSDKYLSKFSYGYGNISVSALGGQVGVSKPERSIMSMLPNEYANYLNILKDPWENELKMLYFGQSGDLSLIFNGWTRSLTGTFAYFGEQFGGSPLLQNVPYAFFVDPGRMGAITSEDSEIRIQVYSREDNSHVDTIEIDVDDLVLEANSLSDDERNALLAGLTLEVEEHGLHTIVSLSRGHGDDAPEFMVWHRASHSDYIYVVETNSSVSTSNSSSATRTLTFDGTFSLGDDRFAPLYTLSFSENSRSAESTEVKKDTAFGDSLLPFYLVGKDKNGAATATRQNLDSAELDYSGSDLSNVQDVQDNGLNAFRYLPESDRVIEEGVPLTGIFTPELRQHSVLDEFVEKYNYDPIALTNYVFNEIELIDEMSYNQSPEPEISLDPGGVQRSALAVFLEKKGSPTEQCALLVYFLRKCGIPAGYASGERNKLLLDTDLLSSILRINLKQYSGIPNQVPVNYPWVVAFIDPDGNGSAEGDWVHLFPWLKDIEVEEGFDLFSLMPDDYNTAWEWVMGYFNADENILPFRFNDTSDEITQVLGTESEDLPTEYRSLRYASDYDQPFALFPRFVEWQLREQGLDVNLDEDVGMYYRYRNNYYARWQDFPQPSYFDGNIKLFAGLGEIPNIFDTIEYRVYGASFDGNGEETSTGALIETGAIYVCDLHNRKLIIENLPQSGDSDTKNISFKMAAYDALSSNAATTGSWPISYESNDSETFQQPALEIDSGTKSHSLERTVLHIVHRKNRAYTNLGNILDNWSLTGGSLWAGFDDTRLEVSTLEGGRRVLDYELIWYLDKGVYAVCNNFGTVSREMLKVHGQELTEYERSNASGDTDIERDTRIYLMGMQYWEYTSRFKQEMARLLKVRYITDRGIMVAGLDADDDGNPVFPKVDIFAPAKFGYLLNGTFDLGKNIPFSDTTRDFYHLVGCQGSSYEHGTINKYFGQLGAVSTMRIFHLAKERGDPVHMITYQDWLDYQNNVSGNLINSITITHEKGDPNEALKDSALFSAIETFFNKAEFSDDEKLHGLIFLAPSYYEYYTSPSYRRECAGLAPVPYIGTMGGYIYQEGKIREYVVGNISSNDESMGEVFTNLPEGTSSVPYQTKIRVWAIPKPGYGLENWSSGSDYEHSGNYRSIEVKNGPIPPLTANFQEKNIFLNVVNDIASRDDNGCDWDGTYLTVRSAQSDRDGESIVQYAVVPTSVRSLLDIENLNWQTMDGTGRDSFGFHILKGSLISRVHKGLAVVRRVRDGFANSDYVYHTIRFRFKGSRCYQFCRGCACYCYHSGAKANIDIPFPFMGTATLRDNSRSFWDDIQNANADIVAYPAAGFRFVNWSGDSNSSNPSINLSLLSNKSITANFEIDPEAE